MTTPGLFTLREIQSQPEVWAVVAPAAQNRAEAWQTFLAPTEGSLALFFGCGSTYYLAQTAASVWQTLTGRPARGVPSSELFLYSESWIPAGASLTGIAISRSGTTTETIRAADYLSTRYMAPFASVTCYPGTPLVERSQFSLLLPEAQEESVAQTRSFASMLIGCLGLAALAGGQAEYLAGLAALPAVCERLLQDHTAIAQSWGPDLELTQTFFLGSGPRYGLACEVMLKMKEMSLTSSEAYHFMEFRHGPKSMVDEHTLVVGLLSDVAREAEMAVLREMKELGGRVLVLAESAENLDWADYVVPFGSNLPEIVRLPLYLPILQLFAYYRSVGKGLNPDSPRNLEAVVKL